MMFTEQQKIFELVSIAVYSIPVPEISTLNFVFFNLFEYAFKNRVLHTAWDEMISLF